MKCRNIRLLIWKNYLVKTRAWKSLVLQIFLPVALIALIGAITPKKEQHFDSGLLLARSVCNDHARLCLSLRMTEKIDVRTFLSGWRMETDHALTYSV
jgi:hypothetical protein